MSPSTNSTPIRWGKPLKNAAQASDAFVSLWQREAKSIVQAQHPDQATRWDGLIEQQKPSARSDTCANVHSQILSSLGDAGAQQATLYGALGELERSGSCWVLQASRGFDTLMAVLEPTAGELLLIWAPPEG